MKKLAALGIATAVLGASCAGHGASPGLPPGTAAQNGARSTAQTALADAAPSGWATTHTRALKITNASNLGAASATRSITIRVGLAMRNKKQLESLVANGQRISDAAFLSTYAPTSSDVSAVTSYLQSKGLSGITVEPNNLLISARGTIAQVQSAFDTSIHSYSGGGTRFIANVTPAYVPSSLSGIVVAVLGLNDLQAFKATPQVTSCQVEGVSTPPQECLRFYDPATFQTAYDAGTLPAATRTNVAIMAEGDVSQAISDFRLNETNFNLPQVPVKVIKVGAPSTDTAGDSEWTLDMTYSTGIAQSVKNVFLYDTTSLTDSDIALEYNRWVTQDYSRVGNSSFGGCEVFPFLDGSMLVDDEILLDAAAHGQTMFASSGDNGGYCNTFVDTNGAPGGAPFVMYPAASPYVAAVGGTDLFTNADGTYKGESSWEAGGGGLSQFEYSPYWETKAQPVSQNALSMRGVPDVAMDASLETGAELWGGSAVNGSCTPCVTGGTSLASPLSAGIWARILTVHRNLGFAPVWYYNNFTQHAAGAANAGPPPWQPDGAFHDILSGTNGLFTAAPGYDYTTGLGSFDMSLLSSQV